MLKTIVFILVSFILLQITVDIFSISEVQRLTNIDEAVTFGSFDKYHLLHFHLVLLASVS